MALILTIDLRLPLRVAGGIPYVAPVLLSLWCRRVRVPLLVAAAATILTLAGFLLAEQGVRDIPNALTNRLLAVGAIWTTATLVALYIRAELARQESLREAERVRTLAAGLLLGQDQERRRISRELHDSLNQRLAALSMELDALHSQMGGSEAARGRLHAIEERVMAMSEEVRRVSHQLQPSILEHAGFVAALRSHCREFSKQTEIPTQVTVENAPERINPVVATALFRLSQEALQNVARHSGATEVRVRISGDSQGIGLSIIDNGKGFDVARSGTQAGLGLISMNERARSLGGRLSIDSPPQGGVTVTVWVPLDQPTPG